MDPGESASETCIREVWEETRLQIQVTRLIGVYTTPDMLIEHRDGNKVQPGTFSFEAKITGGELGLGDETVDFGWYTVVEIDAMDTLEHHLTRIHDAVKNTREAFFGSTMTKMIGFVFNCYGERCVWYCAWWIPCCS